MASISLVHLVGGMKIRMSGDGLTSHLPNAWYGEVVAWARGYSCTVTIVRSTAGSNFIREILERLIKSESGQPNAGVCCD